MDTIHTGTTPRRGALEAQWQEGWGQDLGLLHWSSSQLQLKGAPSWQKRALGEMSERGPAQTAPAERCGGAAASFWYLPSRAQICKPSVGGESFHCQCHCQWQLQVQVQVFFFCFSLFWPEPEGGGDSREKHTQSPEKGGRGGGERGLRRE